MKIEDEWARVHLAAGDERPVDVYGPGTRHLGEGVYAVADQGAAGGVVGVTQCEPGVAKMRAPPRFFFPNRFNRLHGFLLA